MSNAHAIQRGSKAGTDLDDVTGNTKELIKRDTGFVVKVVALIRSADQLVHLLKTSVVFGNQDGVVVIAYLILLSGAWIGKQQLFSQIDFAAMQIFQSGLITGHLFGDPLIDVTMLRKSNGSLPQLDSLSDIVLKLRRAVYSDNSVWTWYAV